MEEALEHVKQQSYIIEKGVDSESGVLQNSRTVEPNPFSEAVTDKEISILHEADKDKILTSSTRVTDNYEGETIIEESSRVEGSIKETSNNSIAYFQEKDKNEMSVTNIPIQKEQRDEIEEVGVTKKDNEEMSSRQSPGTNEECDKMERESVTDEEAAVVSPDSPSEKTTIEEDIIVSKHEGEGINTETGQNVDIEMVGKKNTGKEILMQECCDQPTAELSDFICEEQFTEADGREIMGKEVETEDIDVTTLNEISRNQDLTSSLLGGKNDEEKKLEELSYVASEEKILESLDSSKEQEKEKQGERLSVEESAHENEMPPEKIEKIPIVTQEPIQKLETVYSRNEKADEILKEEETDNGSFDFSSAAQSREKVQLPNEGESKELHEISEVMYDGKSSEEIPDKDDINRQTAPGAPETKTEDHSEKTVDEGDLTQQQHKDEPENDRLEIHFIEDSKELEESIRNSEPEKEKIDVQGMVLNIEEISQEDENIYEVEKVDSEKTSQQEEEKYEEEKVTANLMHECQVTETPVNIGQIEGDIFHEKDEWFEEPVDSENQVETPIDKTPDCIVKKDKSETEKIVMDEVSFFTEEDEENSHGEREESHEEKQGDIFLREEAEAVAGIETEEQSDKSGGENKKILKMVNLNGEPEIAKVNEGDQERNIEETTNSGCEEETHQIRNAKDNNEVDIQEEKTDVEKVEITSETVPEDQIEQTNSESMVTNTRDSMHPDLADAEMNVPSVNSSLIEDTNIGVTEKDNEEFSSGPSPGSDEECYKMEKENVTDEEAARVNTDSPSNKTTMEEDVLVVKFESEDINIEAKENMNIELVEEKNMHKDILIHEHDNQPIEELREGKIEESSILHLDGLILETTSTTNVEEGIRNEDAEMKKTENFVQKNDKENDFFQNPSDSAPEERFTEDDGRKSMKKEIEKDVITEITIWNEMSQNQSLTLCSIGERKDEEPFCVPSEEKNQEQETIYSSNEKVDENLKEEETDNGNFSFSSAAKLTEKVHPINEGESNELDEIYEVMHGGGSSEQVPDKDDINSKNVKCDIVDVSENKAEEGLQENGTENGNGSENVEEFSEDMHTEAIADIGPSTNGSGNDDVDPEAKTEEHSKAPGAVEEKTEEHSKAPGALEAKSEEYSKETVDEGNLAHQCNKEESEKGKLETYFVAGSDKLVEPRGNSEPEEENIVIQDSALNVQESSQEDEIANKSMGNTDFNNEQTEQPTAESNFDVEQIEGGNIYEGGELENRKESSEEPMDSESQVDILVDETPDCIMEKDNSDEERAFTEDVEKSHTEREESDEEKHDAVFLTEEAEAVAGIYSEDQCNKSGGENKKIIGMVNLSNIAETAIVNDKSEKEMNIGEISDSNEMLEGTIQDRVGAWNEETSNSGCKEEVHQMNDEENNEVDIHEENTDVEKVEIISESLCEDQIEETYSESVPIDTRDLKQQNKEITKIADLNNTRETPNTKEEGNQEKNIGDMSDTHESFEGAIYDEVGKEDEEITYSRYEEEINQNADTNDDTEVSVHEEGTDTKRLEIISNTASENQCKGMPYEAKTTKNETTLGDYMSSKAVVGHETKDSFIEGDIQGGEVKGESETLTQEQNPEASKVTDNVPVGIPKHEQNVVLDTEISQEWDIEEQETISSKNEIAEEILRKGESKDLYVTSEVMYGGRSSEEVPDKEDKDSQIAPGDSEAEAEEYSKETADEGNSELDEQNINVQELISNVEETCQEDEKIYEEEKLDRKEISQEVEQKYEAEKVFGSCSTAEMPIEDKLQRGTNTEDAVEKINQTVNDNEVNDRNIGADLEEVTEKNSLTDFNEEETDQTTEESNVDVKLIDAEREKSDEEKHSATFLPKEAEAVPGIDTEEQNDKSGGENREIIDMVNLSNITETAIVNDEGEEEMNIGDISDSNELVEGTIQDRVGAWNEETSNSGCKEEVHQMNDEENNEVNIHEESTDVQKIEIISRSLREDQIEETYSESVAIDARDLIHPNKEQITKIADLNNTPETANTKEEGNQEKNIGDMSDTHESFEGAIYDGVGKEDEEITYSGYEKEINQNADTNDDTEVSVHEEGTDTKRLEIISDTASDNQCPDMDYEAKTTKNETTLGDYMSSKAVVGHETKDSFIEGDIQGGEVKGESETLTQEQIPEASNAIDNVPVGIPKHEQNVVLDTEISQERGIEEQETISSKNEIVEEILREGETKDLYVTSEVMYGGRSSEEVPDKEDIECQIAPGESEAEAEEHSKETADEGNTELDKENINVQELILNVEESCQEDEKIYEEEKLDREEISQEVEKKYEAEKEFGSYSTSEMAIEDKAQRGTNTEEAVEKINRTVNDNEVNNRNIGAVLEEVTEKNSLTDFNEEETDQTTEKSTVDVELIEAEREQSDEEKYSAVFLPKEAEAVPGIDTEEQNNKSGGENREIIEDEAIMDDDSVSIRYETLEGTCQDEEENQMTEEATAESTYRDQADETDEVDDIKNRITYEEVKASDANTISHNIKRVAEMEPVKSKVSGEHENRTMEVDAYENQTHVESPQEQFINAEEAVEVVREFNSSAVDDEKNSDPMKDACEKEFEGLTHDVAEESEIIQMNVFENEINENQDVCVSSETEELQDEAKDEGNEIQAEIEISQTIDAGESNKEEKSEEKKSSERENLELVGLASHFTVQEGLRTENGGSTREELGIEETDDTFEELFQKDERKEQEEATVELKPISQSSELVIAYDTAKDPTSYELIVEMVKLNDESETANVKDKGEKEINIGNLSDSHELVEGVIHDRASVWHEETTNSVCEEETNQILNTKNNNEVDVQVEQTGKFEITSETVHEGQIEETNSESVAPDTRDSTHQNKEISKMADPNNPETTIMKEEDTQEKNIGDISDTQRTFAGTLHDSVGKQEKEITNSGYEEESNQITNIKENREISVHEEGTDNKRLEIISDTVSEDQSQDMAYEEETTKIETTLGDYRSSKAVVGIEVKDSFIEGDIQGSEAKGESEMLTGEQIPEASNATDNVPVGIPKCEHSVVLDTVISGEKAIPEQEGEKIYEVEGNIDESRGNSELDEENIDVQNLVLNVEGSSQEDENTYDVENVERSQEDEKKYEAEKVLGALSTSELSIEDKGQKLTNPEEVVEQVNSTINDNEVHDRNIEACLEVVAEKNNHPDSNEEQTDQTTTESNLDVEQREGGELEKLKESFDEPMDSKRHEETPADETPDCIMKKDKSEDKFRTDHNDVFKEIPLAEESAFTEEDEGEREESHEEKHGAIFLPEEAEAVAGIDIEDQSNKSGGENKEIIKMANLNDEPETANVKEEGEKKMNTGDISDSWHEETTNSACEGETYQTMNAEENNEVDIQEEKTDVKKDEIATGSEPEYHIEETKSQSAATSTYDSTHSDKEIIEDREIMDDDSVSIRNETVEGTCQDKEKIKMTEKVTPDSPYRDQVDETGEVDYIKNRITCEEVEDSNFNTISQNFITVAEMEPVKSKLLEEDETRTMEADAYKDQTQVESSKEQFMIAENAFRGIDEAVKGSNSSEVDDGKTCDPMEDASEKEFEGLIDDVAEESQIVQRDVLENEIDEKQDDCVSSETGELEDKTRYEGNEIQPYKKVSQINNVDKSNKEEKSEEKKCSEKNSLEQVVLKNQSGDSSKETLEKEEINDTIEERFLEDEDKEHEEGTVELEPTNQSSEPFIACDTAKDATSHEVFEELDPNGLEETHHVMNAEDNNDVDIQEEKTDVEKIKITLGSEREDQTEEINSESAATNTRDSVNPDKEVESSDFNTISENFETAAEMEPAKSKLSDEVVNRTKEIDAYEEQTHDASNECKEERRVFPEEGNKYSHQQKESSKGIGITLLEEANATNKAGSMSSKQSQDIEVDKLYGEIGLVCEEKLQSFDSEENQIKETTVEEEALDESLGVSSCMESEEPAAAVQVESPQEQIINAEDVIKGIDELVTVAEESEIVQRDIVENESKKKQEVCVSSETEKLEDETRDEENKILLEKKVSQTMNIDESNKKESSEEKKSSEKDNLEQAELEKPFILGQGGLQTGGGMNTMEKLQKEDTEDTFERSYQEDENREDEEEATVDLQPINQSSETVIACDTAEDATSRELVMEFDSMPSIQNSLGRVLSDKIEPVSLMDKEDEKKNVEAPDADVENETTHDEFQKDEVEIEKNKEPQKTWETKSTRTMEDEIPNDNVKEFDCIPSQQNSMVVVLTEKTETTLSKEVEGESPNDEVEFGFRPLEQNSTVTFFNEKVQTSLTEDEENKKKSFAADLKGIEAHEQFKKDEIEAYKNTEPQTTWEIEATDSTVNEFQNYEVKELDCNPSEQNSETVFLPEKLETSILMDEGDDKKKLDGLSLTTTLAEETMHEVSQKNEVSDFMLSRSTQDEEMVVELAKETSVEYPTEFVHETITKDIPIDLIIRGEEVPKWTPITLLIPEETRIEAFNQKDRDEIGEASNLVSKMEVDQRNYSPVEVTEDEGKSHELSIAQATEVRPPTERERVHQIEEDSSVPIEFETTENEEKHKDFDDLPVSRLLLEHILRNKDGMHDQASDAVPLGEKLQENSGKGSSSATTEKQGVSLPAEEEIQQKVEDTSDMLQEEGSHDVKEDIMANESPNDEVKKFECIPSEQNSMIEVVTEKIKTTLLMDEEGGSPKDEVEELDFTPLGKNSTMTILNEKVQTSLPLTEEDEQKNFDAGPNTCDKEEIAHEQFKINAEPQAKWEIEGTDATINEFPTNEVNKLDPKPSEQDSVTVLLTEKIGTVISMDEREEKNNLDILALTETTAEETMHEVSQKNEVSDFMVSKSTQDDSASAHETITKDIIVDLSVRGEEIPKWTPVAVLIPEESRFETLNQEDREEIGEASNFVPKMEVERERVQQTEENSNEVVYDKSSYTTTEGKTPSILESVGHTKNILQSEETIPNPQYNQTRKSIESSTSEIHKHEEALEIKSEITKEETGEEKHDQITERLQDVSYSQKAQQSNLKLESEKEIVQLAAGLLEERSIEISKDKEQMKEATGTQIEEEKTDEEKEEKEEEDEHKIEESGHDVAVIVEARDANSKKVHKKSHNIFSGVGSKVKHSLAKVKKAITGKSSHPKVVSPK